MFGVEIKKLRLNQGMSLKELAQNIGIDPSLLSRIEREERFATENQVKDLAKELRANHSIFLKHWLEDKMFGVLNQYPAIAGDVLKAMETRMEYLTGPRALEVQGLSNQLKEQLARIDELKLKWDLVKPKGSIQESKMIESFGIEYTFESNRIEGNTLTLQETFLVVNEGLTISGKSMTEHLEAINHDDAIDFILDLVKSKVDITEHRLKQIHQLVLKGIDRKNAGLYRKVPVRISGREHIPAEPFMLSKLMEELFRFYNKEKLRMHPVLLAAEMHERLVTIHPFIDGNGRTARLLMNLILLRNGYVIAILKGNNQSRLAYYKALEEVQVNANTTPFYKMIAGVVESSFQAHLNLA